MSYVEAEPSPFVVEKDIPMPRPGVGRHYLYPWLKMEVSDSFLVRCPSDKRERLWNSLTSSKRGAEKRYGLKFAMRAVLNEGGIRVWRIA